MARKLSMEKGASKLEARNSKFETNPNVLNPKDSSLLSGFEFLDFEFVSVPRFAGSIFGFRFFQSLYLFCSGLAGLGWGRLPLYSLPPKPLPKGSIPGKNKNPLLSRAMIQISKIYNIEFIEIQGN